MIDVQAAPIFREKSALEFRVSTTKSKIGWEFRMDVLLTISSILLWVVVLFHLLITFQLIRISAPDVWNQNASKLKKGQAAPDFKSTDLDGKSITLASFRGRQLLLVFISPSCSACLEKLGEIRALAENGQGLQVVLICDSNEHISRVLAKDYQLDLPVMAAFRNQDPIWVNYKVAGTPSYCLINEQSRVAAAGLFDGGWEAIKERWLPGDGQDDLLEEPEREVSIA